VSTAGDISSDVDVGATREEALGATGECRDCCKARPVVVDVIPGATVDLGRERLPGDETLPMASYLCTISVMVDGGRPHENHLGE